VEILDAGVTPPRSLWRSDPTPVSESGILSIAVSPAFLKPGDYQIAVYGIDGDRQQHVEMYAMTRR
jgi:hypothetical protein